MLFLWSKLNLGVISNIFLKNRESNFHSPSSSGDRFLLGSFQGFRFPIYFSQNLHTNTSYVGYVCSVYSSLRENQETER